jgi:hypothetical protein
MRNKVQLRTNASKGHIDMLKSRNDEEVDDFQDHVNLIAKLIINILVKLNLVEHNISKWYVENSTSKNIIGNVDAITNPREVDNVNRMNTTRGMSHVVTKINKVVIFFKEENIFYVMNVSKNVMFIGLLTYKRLEVLFHAQNVYILN